MKARLRDGYETVYRHLSTQTQSTHARMAQQLLRTVLATEVVMEPEFMTGTGSHVHLLFFDGGLRGNPGPGGSGAIQVCWIGSMAYASKKATNNMAENMGLLAGLKACEARKYEPLHVIGDSAMIIRQQAQRKPFKAKHLRNYYWSSRKIADKLNVIQWHHHLRGQNKMADCLANLAMDSKRSFQMHVTSDTAQLQRWNSVLTHMDGDVAQWQSANRQSMRDSILMTPQKWRERGENWPSWPEDEQREAGSGTAALYRV